MTSSVARPPSDEWRRRHPSRPHLHPHNPLPKVLTRLPTSIDPAAATAARTVEPGGSEPCSPAAEAKRLRSQILDRWAARQAREMITTIERQAHEAELSALSTTTQPVSARAASFLRESSPDGGGGNAASSDIPSSVRASSLIQMWRELEAEAGVFPQLRDVPPPTVTEEASGESDVCDDAEICGDWENAASLSSAESEMTERRRVGEIVRMLSLRIPCSTHSSSDESEAMVAAPTAKEINTPSFARSMSVSASMPSPAHSRILTLSSGRKAIRVRGRREIEDLILRMEQDRRREVAALAERRPVSGFPFRGRIQSLIRLRSLRREVATIRHQQCSRKLEAERCRSGSNNLFLSLTKDQGKRQSQQEEAYKLSGECECSEDEKENAPLREISEDRSQSDIKEFPTEETMSSLIVQPSDSDTSGFAISTDHSFGENKHGSELVSMRNFESSSQSFCSPQTLFTPLSIHEDMEESSSPDASWDERSSWGNSIDWQRPSESPLLQTWRDEVANEGTEMSIQEHHASSVDCNWLSEPSNTWRGWSVMRKAFYNDLLNMNVTANGEIRELLEMRTVSTCLASEFSTKMNQVIASFLHRQGQHYVDENEREEFDQGGIWRQNYESSSDQEASATPSSELTSEMVHNHETWQSISLPLPSQGSQCQKSWQNSSFTQTSKPNIQEQEDMHDLNNSIAHIHHEISELRKLVESCVDWHKKLEHSIKQEVFSAVKQLAGRGNPLYNSNCMQGKKDNCCICCEAQVDSLLYRCGHMCACYKCAKELQWSSGRCPICRSIIADVIRAYPNS